MNVFEVVQARVFPHGYSVVRVGSAIFSYFPEPIKIRYSWCQCVLAGVLSAINTFARVRTVWLVVWSPFDLLLRLD